MGTDALCFDMYGTLCDTSSMTETLRAELDLPAQVVDDLDALWRQKQLQYSYQLGQMRTYRPFWEATSEALDYSLSFYGRDPDTATRERILDQYNHLDPFPDTLDALATLEDEYTLAVLSNGNPEMLETLAANTGIDEHVEFIISADEVETFKPAPEVYENAADRLDTPLGDCALVSSNAWDIAGAAQAGMGAFWVNRKNEPMETIGGDPDVVADTLSDLAEKL
jgi:2-haloacid dehalogenase